MTRMIETTKYVLLIVIIIMSLCVADFGNSSVAFAYVSGDGEYYTCPGMPVNVRTVYDPDVSGKVRFTFSGCSSMTVTGNWPNYIIVIQEEGTYHIEAKSNTVFLPDNNYIIHVGHEFNDNYVVDQYATCTEDGYSSIHCSRCDEIDESSIVVLHATGHEWSDWHVKTDSTCIMTGEEIRICNNDDSHIETRAIPLNDNHSWGNWIITIEPSCVDNGEETRVCNNDPSHIEKRILPATGNHSWNEGTITRAPTIVEPGIITYTCTICGETNFEEIPVITKIGWIKEDGKWYYYKDDGSIAIGWQKISSKWYYLNAYGMMQTGWIKLSGKWYYLNSSGAMVTGWQKIGNKDYFFKSSGVMATNEWVKGYWWVNQDGTWTYKYKGSWKKSGSRWWFGDTSKWYAKNTTITIDGKKYTFDKSGWLI